MSNPKLTIVQSDDWAGLYVNGRLEAQGHSIRNHEILDALGVTYEFKVADEEWLQGRGDLPTRLSEVETIN